MFGRVVLHTKFNRPTRGGGHGEPDVVFEAPIQVAVSDGKTDLDGRAGIRDNPLLMDRSSKERYA